MRAPCFAKARTVARPNPADAPVTTTTSDFCRSAIWGNSFGSFLVSCRNYDHFDLTPVLRLDGTPSIWLPDEPE